MHNIGGNVAIHVNDYHENTSSVTIINSTIAYGSAAFGGGLYIRVEVVQDLHTDGSSIDADTFLNVLAILKTNFTNNLAIERGGGVYISHKERSITDQIKRYISFKNCQFLTNSIQHHRFRVGAAVYIFKHEIPEITSHTVLLFHFTLQIAHFTTINSLKIKELRKAAHLQ